MCGTWCTACMLSVQTYQYIWPLVLKKTKTDTDRPDGCVMIRGQSFKCNIKSWSRLDEPWRDGAFVHCSVS